jgi:hypothetical protein
MCTALKFDPSDVTAITEKSLLIRAERELVDIPFSEIPSNHPSMKCKKIAAIVKEFTF